MKSSGLALLLLRLGVSLARNQLQNCVGSSCNTAALPRRLVLSSTATAAEWRGGQLGEFVEEGIYDNRPYFKQKDDTGKAATFLFHNGACGKRPVWMVGWTELGKCNAALRAIGDTAMPPESGWQYYHRSEWRWDRSLDLE